MDDADAADVIEKARDMAADEGKQGVTGPLIKKAAKEIFQQEPEPKKSTTVDSAKPDTVTGDEAKQCARRALEALAKFKKNAGQLGLIGKEFDKMLNLIEDRLEQV